MSEKGEEKEKRQIGFAPEAAPARLRREETPAELESADKKEADGLIQNREAEARHEGLPPEKLKKIERAGKKYKEDLRGAKLGLQNDLEYLERMADVLGMSGDQEVAEGLRRRMEESRAMEKAGDTRGAARNLSEIVQVLRSDHENVPYKNGREKTRASAGDSLFDKQRAKHPEKHIKEIIHEDLKNIQPEKIPTADDKLKEIVLAQVGADREAEVDALFKKIPAGKVSERRRALAELGVISEENLRNMLARHTAGSADKLEKKVRKTLEVTREMPEAERRHRLKHIYEFNDAQANIALAEDKAGQGLTATRKEHLANVRPGGQEAAAARQEYLAAKKEMEDEFLRIAQYSNKATRRRMDGLRESLAGGVEPGSELEIRQSLAESGLRKDQIESVLKAFAAKKVYLEKRKALFAGVGPEAKEEEENPLLSPEPAAAGARRSVDWSSPEKMEEARRLAEEMRAKGQHPSQKSAPAEAAASAEAQPGKTEKELSPEAKLALARLDYARSHNKVRSALTALEGKSPKTVASLWKKMELEIDPSLAPEDRKQALEAFAKKYKLYKRESRLMGEAVESRSRYLSLKNRLGEKMYADREAELRAFVEKEWPPEKRTEEDKTEVENYIKVELNGFRSRDIFNRLVISEALLLQEEQAEILLPEKKGLLKRSLEYAKEKAIGIAQFDAKHKWARRGLMYAVATGAMFIRSGGTAGISEMMFFVGSRLGMGAGLTWLGEQQAKRHARIRENRMDEKTSALRRKFATDPSEANMTELEKEYAKAHRAMERERVVDMGLRMIELGLLGFLTGQTVRGTQELIFHGKLAPDLHVAPEKGETPRVAHLRKMPHLRRASVLAAETAAAAEVSRGKGISALFHKLHEGVPEAKGVGTQTGSPEALPGQNAFVEVNTGGKDSFWLMTERQLGRQFGHEFAKLDSAQKTYLVDYVRQKMGSAAHDVMHKGETVDYSKIFGDKAEMDKAFRQMEHLTKAQTANIDHNNHLLTEWVRHHPGERLDTKTADHVIAEAHQHVPPEHLPIAGEPSPKVEIPPEMYAPETSGGQEVPPEMYAPSGSGDSVPPELWNPAGYTQELRMFYELRTPSVLKEMMSIDRRTHEFSAIRRVPVHEYMSKVPSLKDIEHDHLKAELLEQGKLTANVRLDDGSVRHIALTKHHLELREFMQGMQSRFRGPVRYASMQKFAEILRRAEPLQTRHHPPRHFWNIAVGKEAA